LRPAYPGDYGGINPLEYVSRIVILMILIEAVKPPPKSEIHDDFRY